MEIALLVSVAAVMTAIRPAAATGVTSPRAIMAPPKNSAGTSSALVALATGVLGGAGIVLGGRLAAGRNSAHGPRYAERHAA